MKDQGHGAQDLISPKRWNHLLNDLPFPAWQLDALKQLAL